MCEHICEPVKWTSLVDARVGDDAAGGVSRCDNSCVGYASDGFCDDGGAGALFGQCALGSDCSDCSPKLYSMSNHRTRHPGCMAAVRAPRPRWHLMRHVCFRLRSQEGFEHKSPT